MSLPRLEGFFYGGSEHADAVTISLDPDVIYFEDLRGRRGLSFDFVVENRGPEDLVLTFMKAAAFDAEGHLLTYRYANRNAVGPSGIDTLGTSSVPAGETTDIYNPFYEWPEDLPVASIRYTFTFVERGTRREIYIGNVEVLPRAYVQEVALRLPLKGLITVLDSHDHLSHHRRFAMTLVRRATGGAFSVNFSRFGFDFALLGEDGNLCRMRPDEVSRNRDFHYTDIRQSYTDGAPVYAPASGVVVEAVNHLDDMYDESFDTDQAIREGRIRDIAGNRVILQHNEREYSHLFHFKKGSLVVSDGQTVEAGQLLGNVGFSGTATVYSHVHYQLMNGPDFMNALALPVEFSDITLVRGLERLHVDRIVPETGDFLSA